METREPHSRQRAASFLTGRRKRLVLAPPSLGARTRRGGGSEPARPAIIDGERIISYRELWRDALGHSAALRSHGAEERDIMLVQLPNWHEFVVLAVAAEIARVVFAFCPIQWGLRETARALRLIKPKIWFTTRYPRGK